MCGGKKSSPAPAAVVTPNPADADAALRSQNAQEQAQHQANAAKIISSTNDQQPATSFGADLAG